MGWSLGSITNAGYVDVASSAIALGDDPLVYPTMDKKVHLSPLETALIELLSLCDSAGARHGFYDEILALLCHLRKNGVDITKGKRQDMLVSEMRKKVNMPNPLATRVASRTVIYFPFIDMLRDLLRSSKFSNVAKLCVNQNVEDWFKHFHPSSSEDYSEMMSRNWANATGGMVLVCTGSTSNSPTLSCNSSVMCNALDSSMSKPAPSQSFIT
jgi:hypothetical protein